LIAVFLTSAFSQVKGPLKEIGTSSPTVQVGGLNQVKEKILNAHSISIEFKRSRKLKETGRTFTDTGRIFYTKKPLQFKLVLPDEILILKEKTLYRIVPDFEEIYIENWDGNNPILSYFSLLKKAKEVKRNVYEIKEDDTVKKIYLDEKGFIRKITTENPLMIFEIAIEKFSINGRIKKSEFKIPEMKKVDLRR